MHPLSYIQIRKHVHREYEQRDTSTQRQWKKTHARETHTHTMWVYILHTYHFLGTLLDLKLERERQSARRVEQQSPLIMNLTCVSKIFAPSCQCRAIVFRLGFPIPIGHEHHKINEISQMRKRMQAWVAATDTAWQTTIIQTFIHMHICPSQ